MWAAAPVDHGRGAGRVCCGLQIRVRAHADGSCFSCGSCLDAPRWTRDVLFDGQRRGTRAEGPSSEAETQKRGRRAEGPTSEVEIVPKRLTFLCVVPASSFVLPSFQQWSSCPVWAAAPVDHDVCVVDQFVASVLQLWFVQWWFVHAHGCTSVDTRRPFQWSKTRNEGRRPEFRGRNRTQKRGRRAEGPTSEVETEVDRSLLCESAPPPCHMSNRVEPYPSTRGSVHGMTLVPRRGDGHVVETIYIRSISFRFSNM